MKNIEEEEEEIELLNKKIQNNKLDLFSPYIKKIYNYTTINNFIIQNSNKLKKIDLSSKNNNNNKGNDITDGGIK
jgi:hypothetical protein